MELEVLDTAYLVARRAAEVIAGEARTAVAERGRFILAISGGRTPWMILRALASEAPDVFAGGKPWCALIAQQQENCEGAGAQEKP